MTTHNPQAPLPRAPPYLPGIREKFIAGPVVAMALLAVLLPAGLTYTLLASGLKQRSGLLMGLGGLIGILWLAALTALFTGENPPREDSDG